MKPKKSRLLYQEIAEENDLSKHLVENLLDFYYKNVRTLLSELYHPKINITGLGLFRRRWCWVLSWIWTQSRPVEFTDRSDILPCFPDCRLFALAD